MVTIKGKDLMLFIISNEEKVKAIACSKSCSIDMSTESISSTSKDSGDFDESIPGMKSWSLSSENIRSNSTNGTSYDDMVEHWINGTIFNVQFSTVANDDAVNGVPISGWVADDSGLKGKAYITKLSCSAPDKEDAKWTAEMKGTGKLTKIIPNIS